MAMVAAGLSAAAAAGTSTAAETAVRVDSPAIAAGAEVAAVEVAPLEAAAAAAKTVAAVAAAGALAALAIRKPRTEEHAVAAEQRAADALLAAGAGADVSAADCRDAADAHPTVQRCRCCCQKTMLARKGPAASAVRRAAPAAGIGGTLAGE